MPERIAIHRLIVGGGKKEDRREVMPGERIMLTDEDAKHLDAKVPPVVRRLSELVVMSADRAAAEKENRMLAGIAQPVEEDPSPAAFRTGDDSNITRDRPPADDDREPL